jgi:FtsH-binding integral membrane protein
MLRDLSAYKKMMMFGIIGLLFVAVLDAFSNLPVVSGCAFYGNCAIAEAPIELSLDPTEQ